MSNPPHARNPKDRPTGLEFSVLAGEEGAGRRGRLATPHGVIETPAFMPVGTYGSVRGITPAQLEAAGVQILLANAYHLALRPGSETISKLGGLHRFMGWDRPILTDSGGYQMFSLAESVKVDEAGAVFRSHVDGARIEMTPERVVRIETELGVDIGMALDVLTAVPGDRDAAAAASEQTLRWARRTRSEAEAIGAEDSGTSIFGIQQGGLFEDLRRENSEELSEMGFPGHSVGGLSVGEAREETMRVAQFSVQMLPADKPRYMMGMGTPCDLVDLSGWGYDLYDCVIPTRNARNGTFFTRSGPLPIRNARNGEDTSPIEDDCECYTCRHFSRAYLHHLVRRKEMLGATLGSLHNVHFYQRLMADIRAALEAGTYEEFRRDFKARYEGEQS